MSLFPLRVGLRLSDEYADEVGDLRALRARKACRFFAKGFAQFRRKVHVELLAPVFRLPPPVALRARLRRGGLFTHRFFLWLPRAKRRGGCCWLNQAVAS